MPFSEHCNAYKKVDQLEDQEDNGKSVAGHKGNPCTDIKLVIDAGDRWICRNDIVMLDR